MRKKKLKILDVLIGKQIREGRKAKNFTLVKLAGALGVTYQYVQQCEAGEIRLSAPRLLLISKALEIPPEYFLKEGKDYLISHQ